MDIIGLSGRRGSGKNVVGDYLAKQWGYTQVSFAAKLKESAAAIFGIDPASFEETKNDPSATITYRDRVGEITLTVREYLQRYGTESHRDVFGYDFWRRALMDGLAEDWHYVITDVRFEDELTALRERGGIIWRVQRDTAEAVEDAHSSEDDPASYLIDVYLSNNGTFEELYHEIDNLILGKESDDRSEGRT